MHDQATQPPLMQTPEKNKENPQGLMTRPD